MKLVLFDIDGTLLWTDGAGRRAIHGALLDEAGAVGPIDSYRFDGKTDPQIVRELLTLAGHPAADDEADGGHRRAARRARAARSRGGRARGAPDREPGAGSGAQAALRRARPEALPGGGVWLRFRFTVS